MYVLPGLPNSLQTDHKLQLSRGATCFTTYPLLASFLASFHFHKLLSESLCHGVHLEEIQTKTSLLTMFADEVRWLLSVSVHGHWQGDNCSCPDYFLVSGKSSSVHTMKKSHQIINTLGIDVLESHTFLDVWKGNKRLEEC